MPRVCTYCSDSLCFFWVCCFGTLCTSLCNQACISHQNIHPVYFKISRNFSVPLPSPPPGQLLASASWFIASHLSGLFLLSGHLPSSPPPARAPSPGPPCPALPLHGAGVPSPAASRWSQGPLWAVPTVALLQQEQCPRRPGPAWGGEGKAKTPLGTAPAPVPCGVRRSRIGAGAPAAGSAALHGENLLLHQVDVTLWIMLHSSGSRRA